MYRQRSGIKLTSLEIIDFKNLQKGTISWQAAPTSFGVIAVRDFGEKSMLFQAFQFAFGHETDVRDAEVIVTLQSSGRSGNVEIVHFKHSKRSIGEQVQTGYAIQIVGVDADYRNVSKEEYFEHLANLKVYASNQVFLFEGNQRNILASSKFDLRSHLEMFLMGKSQRNNDYAELDQKKDVLFGQKKTHAWSKRELDNIDKGFRSAADARDEKKVAMKNEQESYLLQSFYHQKNKELLKSQTESFQESLRTTRDVESDQVVDQIYNWDRQMDENGLSMKFNKLLAATEARFGELFDQERMSMDAEQDDLAMKQKVNTELCDRFNDNYPLTELNDVDLNIQAIAAQNELFMARCGQILDTITARQSKRKRTNSVKLGEKLFEERLPDDLPDLLYDKYCEAQFKLHRGKAFNAQTSQWQLSDDFAQGHLPDHLFESAKDGGYMLHTNGPNEAIERSLQAKNDEWMKGRLIWYECPSNADLPVQEPNGNVMEYYGGCAKGPSKHFDEIQATSSLQSAIHAYKMGTNQKHLEEAMDDIKEKDYFIVDTEVHAPKNVDSLRSLQKAEHDLAKQQLSSFNNLLHAIGFDGELEESQMTKRVDMIKHFQRHHSAQAANELESAHEQLQQKITQLNRFDQQIKDELTQYQVNAVQKSPDDLLREGGVMVDSIKHDYMKSVVRFNEALMKSTDLAIKRINEQAALKGWDLTIDPAEEASSDDLFDAISTDFKKSIQPGAQSIYEISEIVDEQVEVVEEALKICDINSPLPFYSSAEVKQKAKRANRLKNQAIRNMVSEERQFDDRVNAFQERFEKFLKNLNELVAYCNTKWNMSVILMYNEPALRYPITMWVEDQQLDPTYDGLSCVNHHLAALVLKLAINRTLDSPILIFDSLDYVIEPGMIKPFMDLLKKMVNKGKQIIFMVQSEQKEMTATSTHHMWIDSQDVEQIADTSDIVLIAPNAEQDSAEVSSSTAVSHVSIPDQSGSSSPSGSLHGYSLFAAAHKAASSTPLN